MKKITLVLISLILITIMLGTVVNAVTEEELKDYFFRKHIVAGDEVYLVEDQKVKVERYLATHDVTEEQADKVIAQVEKAKALLEKNGVSDYTKLSRENKKTLLSIGQEAASVLGLTMTYNSAEKTVEIYEGTTQLDSVPNHRNILVQTGSDNTALVVIVAIALVAIIAVAGTVILKKVRA